MADITPGGVFVDTQKVTAALLNAALAGSLNATAFTGRSASAAPDTSFLGLVVDPAGSGTFYKVTLANLIFDHAALLSSRTADASPDPAADYVLSYDASGAGYKKVLVGNLVFGGGVAAWATPVGADRLAIYDSANGAQKYITLNNLIHGAVAWTTPVGADELSIYDSANGLFKKITLNNLVNGLPAWASPVTADKLPIYDSANNLLKSVTVGVLITGQVAETAPANADAVLVYDASATATRKMVLSDLKTYFQTGLPAVTKYGGTAGVPTAGNVASFTHGLGAVPTVFKVCLVNTSTELGYAVGDEVAIEGFSAGYANDKKMFACMADGTVVRVMRASDAGATASVAHKTTGVITAITEAKWSVSVRAMLVA